MDTVDSTVRSERVWCGVHTTAPWATVHKAIHVHVPPCARDHPNDRPAEKGVRARTPAARSTVHEPSGEPPQSSRTRARPRRWRPRGTAARTNADLKQSVHRHGRTRARGGRRRVLYGKVRHAGHANAPALLCIPELVTKIAITATETAVQAASAQALISLHRCRQALPTAGDC